jgi:hypothetical protein
MFGVAVCDCKTIQNTISIFAAMESYHRTILVAVNDSCSDHVWVIRVCVPQGDVFAIEVDIFKIASLGNDNGIAIVGVVDSCLDVIEIGRAIIVNVDDFCVGSSGEGQYYKEQGNFHFGNTTRFISHFPTSFCPTWGQNRFLYGE